jgi:arylformamidase
MAVKYNIPKTGWIDISWPLRKGMRKWPQDWQPNIEWVLQRSRGDRTDLLSFNIVGHTGTHIDAPLHFVPDGKTIDTMPVNLMVGMARVIEIKDPRSITLSEIKPYDIQEGERVIFKTQNSTKIGITTEFVPEYVYMSIDAAHYLRDRKIALVGIDAIALGPYSGPPEPATAEKKMLMDTLHEVHQCLLDNGIWILESLNLAHVRPGPCILACLPLRIIHGDAGPARAIVRPL